MTDSMDAVLDRVAVESLLENLQTEHRLVVSLTFGIDCPSDWPWPRSRWPPVHSEVGWYVGMKLRGRPISEATVRYIRTNALLELQEFVKNPLKTPVQRRKIVKKRLKELRIRAQAGLATTYE